MAQQFPMSPQASPAAFTTLIPVAPQGTILAEQMKAMTFSGMKNCVLIRKSNSNKQSQAMQSAT